MLASYARKASRSVFNSSRRFLSASKVVCVKNATAASDPSSSSQAYLTPERKRKLITLYHKSEEFVTLENLSDYIDKEFSPTFNKIYRELDDRAKMENELAERRTRPKMIPVEGPKVKPSRSSHMTLAWSAFDEKRNMRLKAALYGVDESLKVGLEMVEEYRARVVPHETKGSES